jgi:serine/threonine protein kinase
MTARQPDNHRSASQLTGLLNPNDALAVLRSLASQLRELHADGTLHRQVFSTQVAADLQTLSPVAEKPVTFGGPAQDVDRCPPEFRRSREIELPADAEAARQICVAAGVLAPPERVDVYQVGTLLCRLVCGRSVMAYLSSPGLLQTIPPGVRTVIDRCIGYDETCRLNSVDELCRLLDSVLDGACLRAEAETSERTAATLGDTGRHGPAETASTRPAPTLKLGQFELLEQIGHGGMGTVYRALDTSLNRTVAVKVLAERLARDAAFVQRFRAEASAAAGLAHECIVPIYFIGEDAGRHFYAMQLVNGESLADRLHQRSRLPLEEALRIVEQTLTGLATAHRQGLVHRDIKPGNILIDQENGRAMLTDFGLARSLSIAGGADAADVGDELVMGTAEYMSPEQARGEPVDPRSDLYSIGAVLYQLLGGTTPFDADTPTGHLMRHVCEEPRPLGELAPDQPPGLIAIVTRLLQKQSEQRYDTVDDLLIDLRPYLQSDESRVEQPGGDSRLAKQTPTVGTDTSKRLPVRNRIAISILVLILAGLAAWNSAPRHAAIGSLLTEHLDVVTTLSFTPDGQYVISGGGESTSLKRAGDTSLRLWDAATGVMLRHSPPLPVRPHQLVPLPASTQIVAFGTAQESASAISVWDFVSGNVGATDFSDPYRFHFAAIATESGTLIAAGHDGISELRVEGGSVSVARQFSTPSGNGVRAFAVCRQRAKPLLIAATKAGDQQVVELIDLETISSRGRLTGFAGPVIAVAAIADGSVIAARSTELIDLSDAQGVAADFVTIWNGATLERRHRIGPLAPASPSLCLTSDGQRLLTIGAAASAGQPDEPQSAVLFETARGNEVCRFQTGSRFLTAVAIGPDDRRAAIADADGQVVLCDLP